jgi:hypothetical protein
MTYNPIIFNDSSSSSKTNDNWVHAGRFGFTSFYGMDIDGNYVSQDLGELTKKWKDFYLSGVANIANIKIDGNTISSTDTDGDINITPDGDGDINLTTNCTVNQDGDIDCTDITCNSIATDSNEALKMDVISGSYNLSAGAGTETVNIAHNKSTNIRGAVNAYYTESSAGRISSVYTKVDGTNVIITITSTGAVLGNLSVVIFYV